MQHRLLVVFLKNRFRSKLSLSVLRRLVILVLFVIAVYGFVYYTLHGSILGEYTDGYPGSGKTSTLKDKLMPRARVMKTRAEKTLPKQVLLVYTSGSLRTVGYMKVFLESQRVDFSMYCHSVASQPALTTVLSGGRKVARFALIIVTDVIAMFSNWTDDGRQLYLSYCRQYNVSLIFISQLGTDQPGFTNGRQLTLSNLRTRTVYSEAVEYLELNSSHKFYYAKSGEKITRLPANTLWQLFEPLVHRKSRDHMTVQQGHVTNTYSHMTGQQGHVTNTYSHMTGQQGHVTNAYSHMTVQQDHVTNTHNHVTNMHVDDATNGKHHRSRRHLQMVVENTPLTRDYQAHATVSNSRKNKNEEQSHVKSNFEVLLSMNYQTNGSKSATSPVVVSDKGKVDGVKKVFIGGPITFWLIKLLLLDVIRDLTSHHPVLRFGRERWVMVDIDDIFVAPKGRKMTPSDVQALVEAQQQFRDYIPGFTFNLGFCGQYYCKGTAEEIAGDKELIRFADHFWWFDHTYHHLQPHTVNEEKLKISLRQNMAFAKAHSLPAFTNHYTVSPHHSGTYPVLPHVYHAWSTIWNVTMTTTEEYPHLKPERMRRGFIHRGIMVVPRRTCRLFTHTFLFDHFRGGKGDLLSFAEGGEVFNILLSNPVLIFMTHLSNFAHDRLAVYLFNALFSFVRRWTQLELIAERPLTLGKKYFEIFPEDKMPVWTSPCRDSRHMDIWPQGHNCSRLPSLLILGPQKSGTTALYTFLNLHSDMVSNRNTREHFEEIQFFSNDTIYRFGIDWYMDQFPYPKSPSQKLFEKSATYLTHQHAPLRAHTLLPEVKLIIILHNPIKRAYSWYQHMIAHHNPTATRYSFSEIIRSNPNSTTDRRVLSLRSQCLLPGEYHRHITRWLEHFPPKQLLFIDGDELVEQPAHVMDSVQKFLKIPQVNYLKLLRYDKKKGFYCASRGSRPRCLGPSKGRHYPAMSESDRDFLRSYYIPHNRKLLHTLGELSRTPPQWLSSLT